MKILFVCSGNTCRSPMAEALAQQMAKEKGRLDCRFASAGTFVWPGDVASRETVAEMAGRGIPLEGRRARQLDAAMAEEADLILTMTEGICGAVASLFPQAAGKVHTLPRYVGESGDVDDPYGCGEEVYHAAAQQIYGLLEKLFAQLDQNTHGGKER